MKTVLYRMFICYALLLCAENGFSQIATGGNVVSGEIEVGFPTIDFSSSNNRYYIKY